MRILYVDLNPESIFGRTDEVLRSRGHTLFYERTCSDALEMIRNHCCPAKLSGGHSNPLKISMITHGRSRNDLN
jgi:hypothetical protein